MPPPLGAGSGVSGVGGFSLPRLPLPSRAASPPLSPAESPNPWSPLSRHRSRPPLPRALPLPLRPHNTVGWWVWFYHVPPVIPPQSLTSPHVAQPLGQSTPAFRPHVEMQSSGPYTPAGPNQSLGTGPNQSLGSGPGRLHFSTLPTPTAIPRREVWGRHIPEPAGHGSAEAGRKGARPGTPHSLNPAAPCGAHGCLPVRYMPVQPGGLPAPGAELPGGGVASATEQGWGSRLERATLGCAGTKPPVFLEEKTCVHTPINH